MRLRRFILSGVGVLSALIMALAAVAVSTPAASAGTRPPPVIYNQNNGWNNAHVRPHAIYVGNGGSDVFSNRTNLASYADGGGGTEGFDLAPC